jgi:hypothetical protein
VASEWSADEDDYGCVTAADLALGPLFVAWSGDGGRLVGDPDPGWSVGGSSVEPFWLDSPVRCLHRFYGRFCVVAGWLGTPDPG